MKRAGYAIHESRSRKRVRKARTLKSIDKDGRPTYYYTDDSGSVMVFETETQAEFMLAYLRIADPDPQDLRVIEIFNV